MGTVGYGWTRMEGGEVDGSCKWHCIFVFRLNTIGGKEGVKERYNWKHLRSNRSRQVRRPSGAAMAVAPSGPMLLPLQNKEGVVNPHHTASKPAVRDCERD